MSYPEALTMPDEMLKVFFELDSLLDKMQRKVQKQKQKNKKKQSEI